MSLPPGPAWPAALCVWMTHDTAPKLLYWKEYQINTHPIAEDQLLGAIVQSGLEALRTRQRGQI